jgi:hypothetical protein
MYTVIMQICGQATEKFAKILRNLETVPIDMTRGQPQA